MKKKDEKNRICVDFKKLNKLTIADPESMTTAEDLFQRLRKSKYFCKIDLSTGYRQIPAAEVNVEKTTLITHDGTYDFLRMQFRMKKFGVTFVHRMRNILAGLDNMYSYIDD